MNAWEKHRQLIREYKTYYGVSASRAIYERHGLNEKPVKPLTEGDVLRKHYQFVFDDETSQTGAAETNSAANDDWGRRLARRYYEQLFKEYAIADLSRYKERQIALRWRIEKEVIDGKGQFICGEQQCQATQGLKSWEVNFAYKEHGTTKHALVKLRLCHECTEKLHIIQNKKVRKEGGERIIPFHYVPEVMVSSSEPLHSAAPTGEEVSSSSALPPPLNVQNPWKEKILADKSQEEEFQDYLADLLL
jgi:protein FRA10AC1